MSTNHQNNETTLESCYRSSLSDLLIGGGTVLGILLATAWPSLKFMFGS